MPSVGEVELVGLGDRLDNSGKGLAVNMADGRRYLKLPKGALPMPWPIPDTWLY